MWGLEGVYWGIVVEKLFVVNWKGSVHRDIE